MSRVVGTSPKLSSAVAPYICRFTFFVGVYNEIFIEFDDRRFFRANLMQILELAQQRFTAN